MKKYLTVVSLLAILLSLGYYLYFFDGSLYLPDFASKTQVRYSFQVSGDKLLEKTRKGDKEFLVKGVTIDSGIAGYHANDFAIKKEGYLKWMRQIANMGANTIRLKAVMDVDFYLALDEYNQQTTSPLYLLQGVRIDDFRDNIAIDAFHERYRGSLLRDVKDAVDIIHGRRMVWNTAFGSQYYKKDVSKWVLGFIVGDQWSGATVAYTNHGRKNSSYKGEYISTGPEANSFEAMLAQVMDELLAYETQKYGWQHLVSFASSSLTDPFVYRKPFAAQAAKYDQLDIDHLLATKDVKAGLFASYQLLDYHPRALDYLGENKTISSDELEQWKQRPYPENYVGLLKNHHQAPVLISGYGYSTSRGITSLKHGEIEGPLSEKDQGELLVRDYQAFIEAGAVGGILEAWQDDWGARTWNTAFTTNRHSRFQWGDVQSHNQGFGLLTFENLEKQHAVDGSLGEWNSDSFLKTKEADLFVDSDETYLYLAIKKEGIRPEDQWLLPLDITPKTGSKKWEEGKASFQEKVDFLLVIDGLQNSRLLVQERYDAVRANYLKQIKGEDPFIQIPDKDSSQFNTASLILKQNRIFEDWEQGAREEKWNPVYQTGKLYAGNGHRKALDFDSRTDISFGKDGIEIRLPWQLLNFSNPAQGKVHNDYYTEYGVSELAIDQISLGLGSWPSAEEIQLKPYPLAKWEHPRVGEVLKDSYHIMKHFWKEGE